MRIVLFIAIFQLFGLCIFSQSHNQKEEFLNEGEYFFRIEEYEEALFFFLQLYRTDTSNANYNFKVGECYINIPNQEVRAIPYLEKAIKNISIDWDRKLLSETKAPPHALFYLGNAYRIKNDLDRALELYNEFMDLPYFYLHYNQAFVVDELTAVERAKIIKDKPILIQKEVLPTIINTSADQSSPVLNKDETKIIYIEKLKFYDAVMYSQKVDGEWQKPDNITPNVRSDGNLYPTWMSEDGNTVLFVRRSDDDDICISRFVNGKWSRAVSISDNVNTRKDESSASLAEDGKLLLFSSNRMGSNGMDIYYSRLESDGSWSKPKEYSKVLNSDGDEHYPYLLNNGNRIYFISDNHFSMGGLDVFFANRDGDDDFEAPANIGFPINTTNDEMFFFPISDTVIYMSLWPEGRLGNRDIVKIIIEDASRTSYYIPENSK